VTLSRKLILAFMALAGASLVAALVLTTLAVKEAAREKIASELERTLTAFQRAARATQQRTRDVAEARARDKSFKEMSLGASSKDDEAGLGGDTAELEAVEYAHAFIDSADTEAFGWGPNKQPLIWAFFNVKRRLIYTHAAPEQPGNAPLVIPLLETVFTKGPTFALWSPAQLRALPFTFVSPEKLKLRKGDLLLVHAQPAYGTRQETVGVVLTGQWVGDVLLEDPTASTTPGPQIADSSARFAVRAEDGALTSQVPVGTFLDGHGWQEGGARDLYTDDTHYLVRQGELKALDDTRLGQVFVLRDFDAEINPIFERFFLWLIPTAVGIVLCALAAAVFMARSMASPLVQLEKAAGRVRLGDLTAVVPVRGTDEVGRVAQAFNEMVSGLRQRDQIKGLFKRYLSPHMVDELIKHPEKAAPGGERKMLTVLFSDLVGFTSMSEQLSPEALVAILNAYFEQAAVVLTKNGATLDKFIGDAIMCFWNAPLPQEDHAARACFTALELVSLVERLAPEFEAKGLPRLDCRIGINTGAGVAGNIGSSAAQDYTVIGDMVNLASRLEGACKVYGTRTLVSEDTLTAARGAVLARELDLLRVKGKQRPVRVFELVGLAGTPPPPHVTRFAEGLAHYRARRFAEARAAFAASPDDKPSQRFTERCEALLLAPPPDDWDGVFTLDNK
jgi:class 3 adenylate cyclase